MAARIEALLAREGTGAPMTRGGSKRLRGVMQLAGAASLVTAIACSSGTAIVTVHPAQRLQVMQGWEGLLGGTPECNQTAWNGVRDQVLDLVTNDLGLNRVKLPLRSGYEDSTDHFARYMRGETTFDEWKYTWFRPVNDDADPRHANPAGFQWSFLDHLVETQLLPMKRRLQARGDDLWVNLVYVGGRNPVHEGAPAEYAELVEQAILHLRDKYGIVPQSLEVINEPNMHDTWTPVQVAQALLAARARLASIGIAPQFIGPSTSTMQAAETYLDGMFTVPGAREALTDLSYHRYGGNVDVLKRLAARAASLGYRTTMNERIGADQDTLYQDLTVGHVSSWQQFAVVFCPPPDRGDGGGIYVRFTTEDSLHPTARLTPIARSLRQYFRYVRLGASRIGADASGGDVRATAFTNPDGGTAVVVHAGGARDVEVRGLPPGTYGTSWTTASPDDGAASDTTIAAGGALRTRIPGAGVLTVFRR